MEIRGIWITRDDSDVLKSKDGLREALEKLKEFGFNTIYPCVWHSGYTLYTSQVAQDFMGSKVHPEFQSLNLIEELLRLSKEFKFRLIPWFEFGLMVSPNSPIDKLDGKDSDHKDLISQTKEGKKIRKKPNDRGEFVDDEFIWMNPCHPLVQDFIIKLMEEMAAFEVDGHQVDGIQLDDHFGWPKELGYEQLSHNAFNNREDKSEDLHAWGTKQVTELLELIFYKVKGVKPRSSDCLISISPQPLDNSKQNYRLDWSLWERKGIAEEIVLQNYNPETFNKRLITKEVRDSLGHIPTAIGIMAGQTNNFTSLTTIKEQIDEVRKKGFHGFSFFYYETFFNKLQRADGRLTRTPRNTTDIKTLFD